MNDLQKYFMWIDAVRESGAVRVRRWGEKL